MTAKRRSTVIDTSTLVSAILFTNSKPAKATERAFSSGPVLVSYPTAFELQSVLARSKFDRYLDKTNRMALVNDLLGSMAPVALGKPVRLCRDPNDDKFLEVALAGNADYLLTSDLDLLALHHFRKTRILSPTDYLNL